MIIHRQYCNQNAVDQKMTTTDDHLLTERWPLLKSKRSKCFVYLLLFAMTICIPLAATQQQTDIEQVIPTGYNREMRPGDSLERSTLNVSISFFVNDLLGVNDKEQTMEIDIMMVTEWYDRRVNLSAIPETNFVVTVPSTIRQFWLPDLYFVNGLSASVVNAFQSVQKLTITPDGLMIYAQRINAEFSCPLNLQNYPHDYQYCRIKLSTIIYNKTELRLHWKRFSAQRAEYPIFKIRYWYTELCDQTENNIPENSCISGVLKLVRRLSYYIIRYYLLTFLAIAISFVNFWVPINAWPARITLLVMPLMNLITQDISINNDIGINYVTSFHWWMMWLHGIIYLEICEYAVAIQWAHFVMDKKRFAKLLEQANNNQPFPDGRPPPPVPVPPYLVGYYFGNKGWYAACGRFFDRFVYFFFGTVDLTLDPYTRNKVDYCARVIFPGSFVLFTFIYVMITTIYWAANFND